MDTRATSNPSRPLASANEIMHSTTDIDLTADLDGMTPPSQAALERPRAQKTRAVQKSRPIAQLDELQEIARSHDQSRDTALPLAPGRVLLDRYVLTQIIGTGGTCIVFRARDLEAASAGRPAFAAVKTPRPDHADPQRAIGRLQREFEHARRLSHSGIAQVFELKNDGDVWFMTMELLEGQSLAAVVRRHGGSIPAALARRLLKSAAEGLAYAHAAGVVHGDFNMANAFVTAGDHVKILDFGSACSGDQSAAAAATPAYASPQVLEGATPNVRDDVFSFACIAYELITGRHPFDGRPSKEARAEGQRPQAPEQLSTEQALALMAGLAWESGARPTDIKAFAQSITPQPQLRRTIIAANDPYLAPLPSTEHDKRWWVFGAACVVAMIVAVIATRVM